MATKTKMNVGVSIVMLVYGAAMYGMGYITGGVVTERKHEQLEHIRQTFNYH